MKELAKGSQDSEGRENVFNEMEKTVSYKYTEINARVILNKLRKFTCRLAEDTF